MSVIEDESFEEPKEDPFPSSETALELKLLPSTLKYLILIIIALTRLLYPCS